MILRSLGPQPSASTRFRHSDWNLGSIPGAARRPSSGYGPPAFQKKLRPGEAQAARIEAAQHVHVEALHLRRGGVVVAEEADRRERHVGQDLLLQFLLQVDPGGGVWGRAGLGNEGLDARVLVAGLVVG